MSDELAVLESEFHRAMIDIYKRAAREINYRPSYFINLVQEYGGLQAARRLLYKYQDGPSEGFVTLWESGRLDLSMEARVIEERYRPLFSDEERALARRRLEEYGYSPPDEST